MVAEISRTLQWNLKIILPSGFTAIDAKMQLRAHPPIFVISMNTAEGERRRRECNFNYTLIDNALSEDVERMNVSQKMVKGRRVEKGFLATVGCFQSHVKAWGAIGDGPAIVCEDDARLLRDFPYEWPVQPCLLGGALRTKGALEF